MDTRQVKHEQPGLEQEVASIKSLLDRHTHDGRETRKAAFFGPIILATGLFTTLGGDATEVITVQGVETGDTAIVTLNVKGATPRTILTAITSANTITVVLSGDPSTDHVLQYLVVRSH